MFNYLDVNDVVRIRVNFVCEKMNLTSLLILRFSCRKAESHIYKVLCLETKPEGVHEYSLWQFNATTHLLYNKVNVANCKDAFILLANKMN